MNEPGGPAWFHHDHLGSVRLTTDLSGDAAATKDFMPFGEVHASTGSDESNPYDFAGHRTDDESGLIDMNARYSDPVIGRFISADRVVPDILNPQSLNAYAYVYNNPISNVDPTGHEPISAIVVGLILPAISSSIASFVASTWVLAATGDSTLATIVGIVAGLVAGVGLSGGEGLLGQGSGRRSTGSHRRTARSVRKRPRSSAGSGPESEC